MAQFQDPPKAAPVTSADHVTPLWLQWFVEVAKRLTAETGFTGTITTAALTGGGAQGSMTFQNGRLISQVQAT